MSQFIIDDHNYKQHLSDKDYDGIRGYGLVPRTEDPDPSLIKPMRAVQMDLIPDSEWIPRILERKARKERNCDKWRVMNGGQPLEYVVQGSVGWCWTHGPINAQTFLRAKANLPYRKLSAFSVGGPIKNGRDEGAWGALALEYMIKHGACTQDLWPQGKMLLPESPQIQASRADNRVVGSWMDVVAPVYDRNLSKAQIITLLLNDIPVVGDFMWWGHCVAILDLDVVSNSIATVIVNSWPGWGGLYTPGDGMAVLAGSKAWPDNGVAPGSLVTN